MKEITTTRITEAVAQLCIQAAYNLPEDAQNALDKALRQEESDLGKYSLEKICKNAEIASKEELPLCQDTGMAVVFADIGQDIHIVGGSFEDAIHAGIAKGYEEGYLRKSMVAEPLFTRTNTQNNTPALIHARLVKGDCLTLSLLPKGAGSENMSALGMLKPAQGVEGVIDFVVDVVSKAGGNPCPPIVVGVGIGGNAEAALLLSKRALQRPLGSVHPEEQYGNLEQILYERINALGIGPQGFGGKVTALGVHVEHCPVHIASLPVGVSINCHVLRHATVKL